MRKFFALSALCLALLFSGAGMSEAAAATQPQQVHVRLCGVNLGSLPWWWSCYITGYCHWC